VHWCFDCGSALAEAEVEYEDKTSPAIDVAFPVRRRARRWRAAFGLPALPTARPRGDLDDDALDAAGQPGGERCIPSSLRPGRTAQGAC
jgi:hypothetical protein